MNIGLYFGSFNPVHNGHLIIANYLVNYHTCNEVWFVVSPQNPFKKSKALLNENHRFFLIQLAIEGEPKLKVSKIEFGLPKPSYTINTLAYLREKYPLYAFSLIMGSDSFQNLDKWKNAPVLIQNYPLLVFKRPGFEIKNNYDADITIVDAPLISISSTYIRDMIKNKKSIRFLVPDVVKEEIEKKMYYSSILENPSK